MGVETSVCVLARRPHPFQPGACGAARAAASPRVVTRQLALARLPSRGLSGAGCSRRHSLSRVRRIRTTKSSR